jgi:hypothetical protein
MLESAADHKYDNNCNRPENMRVRDSSVTAYSFFFREEVIQKSTTHVSPLTPPLPGSPLPRPPSSVVAG